MSGNKCTNNLQFNLLIDTMKEHPDLAKGYSRRPIEEFQAIWESLTTKLNSLGPPQKDTTAWRKVWTDYKANIKKKLVTNKKYMQGTGGGPAREKFISVAEQEVIELVQLHDAVEGLKKVSEFGAPACHTPVSLDITTSDEYDNHLKQNENISPEYEPIPQKRKCVRQPLNDLVENQDKFHSDIVTYFKKITAQNEESQSNFKEICREIGALRDVKELELHEKKRHNLEMEKMMKEKLELKQRILELHLAR